MLSRGCLGRTTVGFFLLVAFCCEPPTLAVRVPATAVRHRAWLLRGRVTAKTHQIREELTRKLSEWLLVQLPTHSLEDLARNHVDALSEWLEEYMTVMYENGHSRRAAAETLNAVAQRFGWVRSALAGPWGLIRTWEMLEPVQHHPPMPVQVVRALAVTAMVWKWHHVAVSLVLGFFGLLRPSELIGLRRRDLMLPSDHFSTEALYLRVGQPKTRHRAAASQHVRIDEQGVPEWVDLMLQEMPPWRKIWHGSWASFKHRFDLLQLEVLGRKPLLPSSLRPGGATYLFRLWHENLPRLQWRGRWRSFRMLETYVQELGAAECFVRLPLSVRHRVVSLEVAFLDVLAASRR